MIKTEEYIFKDALKNRTKFSDFFNKYFQSFIKRILIETFAKFDKNKCIVFIGGSRSWNFTIKNLKNLETLSLLENKSIIPGNYDVFCVCTDPDYNNYIIQEMCEAFGKIISHFNDKYSFQWDFNGKPTLVGGGKKSKPIPDKDGIFKIPNCPVNHSLDNNGCVFPECRAMHLAIDHAPFFDKVLVYFELFNLNSLCLSLLSKNLLTKTESFNFLNLEGLYLFSKLINNNRTDKEYNVDLYREHIIKKIIKTNNIDEKTLFKHVLRLYTLIFKDRTDFNLKFEYLLKNYITLFDPNIINNYMSSKIVEQYRIYINTFIYSLHESFIDKNSQNYIFVTGGDSYRRYLSDITQTNDIDSKIVYTNYSDRKPILNSVFKKMSELIVLLESSKTGINQTIQLNSKSLNGKITFMPVNNNSQFRLRYINRQEDNFDLLSIDFRMKLNIQIKDLDINLDLNLDLALFDLVVQFYDAKMWYPIEDVYLKTIYEEEKAIKGVVENPYFDWEGIVNKIQKLYPPFNFSSIETKKRFNLIKNTNLNQLIKIQKEYKKTHFDPEEPLNYNYAVTITNGMPIASINYLTNDLRNIYSEISSNIHNRFPKFMKDKQRFEKLIFSINNQIKYIPIIKNLKRKIHHIFDEEYNESGSSNLQKKIKVKINNDENYENFSMDILFNSSLERRFNLDYYNTKVKEIEMVAQDYLKYIQKQNINKSKKVIIPFDKLLIENSLETQFLNLMI